LLGLPQSVSVILQNEDGIWIGSLNLNLGISNFIEPPAGTVFELVAISQGTVLCKSALGKQSEHDFTSGIGWGHPDHDALKDDDLANLIVEEFYYVLWIEWKKGVAYRKGLGRVLKAAWNAMEKEEIDLILG
jgi:hypothetical protein